jgi:hypothetical protein
MGAFRPLETRHVRQYKIWKVNKGSTFALRRPTLDSRVVSEGGRGGDRHLNLTLNLKPQCLDAFGGHNRKHVSGHTELVKNPT